MILMRMGNQKIKLKNNNNNNKNKKERKERKKRKENIRAIEQKCVLYPANQDILPPSKLLFDQFKITSFFLHTKQSRLLLLIFVKNTIMFIRK